MPVTRLWVIAALGLAGCLSTDWCAHVVCAAPTECDPVNAQCECVDENCPGNYACDPFGTDGCSTSCIDDSNCKAGFQCKDDVCR
jgi:hypothetical protein